MLRIVLATSSCGRFRTRLFDGTPPIGGDGQQDNAALQGLFPLRLPFKKDERGTDAGEEKNTSQDAPQISASARNGHTPNDGGGDGLHFEAGAGLGIHVGKPNRIQERGGANKNSGESEDRKSDPRGANAGEARGFRV